MPWVRSQGAADPSSVTVSPMLSPPVLTATMRPERSKTGPPESPCEFVSEVVYSAQPSAHEICVMRGPR